MKALIVSLKLANYGKGMMGSLFGDISAAHVNRTNSISLFVINDAKRLSKQVPIMEINLCLLKIPFSGV